MKKRCNRSWRKKEAQARWFYNMSYTPHEWGIKFYNPYFN